MKFEVERYRIRVIPECEEDIAYIEDTLGLKNDGEYMFLVRHNASGLSCIAYLESRREVPDGAHKTNKIDVKCGPPP